MKVLKIPARRLRQTMFAFCFLNLIMLGFTNCSPVHNTNGESELLTSSVDTSSPEALKAQQILALNCASCHGASPGIGGISTITDLTSLVRNGLVSPGDRAGSRLMQVVSGGSMPPGQPLSAGDISALGAWIDGAGSGAISEPPVEPVAPGETVSTATFASISATILTPKCVNCHGPGAAGGGYRFDSYANVMMAVQARDLAASALYTSTASGRMPKNSTVLGAGDLQVIAEWINTGAANN